MRELATAILAAVFILCAAGHASSIMINGGFETGTLIGWQSIGDVSVQTASIGSNPTQGSYQAALGNDVLAYQVGKSLPNPQGNTWFDYVYPLSGNPAGGANDAFFGLPTGTIQSLLVSPRPGVPTVQPPGTGSGMTQTFSAQRGQTLSFDWNYVTSDGINWDFATVSVVSSGFEFAYKLAGNDIELVGDKIVNLDSLPLGRSGTMYAWETGYQSFSLILPRSGDYTVGVGVFQFGDPNWDSGLLVDNFRIAPVPEPSTLLLLGSGLAGLGGMAWRHRKS